MTELINVQPGRGDGRVALYEVHPDHPDGEAWVASAGQTVQVARTPLVARKLQSGDLVEINPAVAPAAPAPDDDPFAGLELTAEQQQALRDAGVADRAALHAATDDELIAITTIGKATVKHLRAALADAAV